MEENLNNNQQPTTPEAPAVVPATSASEAPAVAPVTSASGVAPASAPEPPKKSQKKWVALAVLLLLLIAAGVAAFLWLTTPNADRDGMLPDANARVGSLSGDFEDLDKIVDEGMLTFSINVTPSFSDGTSSGNLMIENAEINNNRFTCAIYRKDNGEKIYQSGTLDPGQYIENAPLDADLEPGEYPCTAYFETYKLSDNTPIGQAAAEITVYVQG